MPGSSPGSCSSVQEDGTAFHPDYVSRRFAQLAYAAGLPPVTVYGLRHGAATYALAAGVDVKVVQERLGHSSRQLTSDTYTVLDDLNGAAAEAEATVAVIPRAGRRPEGLPTDTQRSSSRDVPAADEA